MFPQVEIAFDVLACANCGFAKHIDWWELEGVAQYNAAPMIAVRGEGQ